MQNKYGIEGTPTNMMIKSFLNTTRLYNGESVFVKDAQINDYGIWFYCIFEDGIDAWLQSSDIN